MFVLTMLVYPCVLALLCVGAGLLVDRASGGWLPGALLGAVGVAVLIAVSQLSTYITSAAPATPYALTLVAVAGFALGWRRGRAFAREWRAHGWQLAVGVLAYVIALAPVLFAGRPTFSSYQSLTDSALHMMGADYLMRHGQDYAHLDLLGSYGQYIHAYYGTGYPSGADTLLGGSALELGLPLIWAFQPFNAFVLATATGPAWVLARRIGLAGGWAAIAALSATVPALVYGYELIGSVKEIVALVMILTLGALVVLHARWLRGRATAVIAPAIVLAAGVSALGVGFGAWGLAALIVAGAVAIGDVVAGRRSAGGLLVRMAVGGAVVIVGALSTWVNLTGSLNVAQSISSTSNPGNLSAPLRPAQALGTWLSGSYLEVPSGGHLTLSYAIAAITLVAVVLGALRIVYMGERALAGWIGLTLAAGAGLAVYSTAWVDAKALVLSSPVIVLVAWAGIAALRASANPRAMRIAAVLVAAMLAGGIAVSDAMQYHASDLAPTARYEELASLDARFAGQGPVLFTSFDEYALYELRDLDVGGLEFTYPPAGLRLTRGHGSPVDLDRVPPAVLRAYPLIVTPRDPTASEPPSAYRLEWQGTYYEVWRRRPGAPVAIAHLGLPGTRVGVLPIQCAGIARVARIAQSHPGARLIAASPPSAVVIGAARFGHSPSWTYTHPGVAMTGAGELRTTFELPRAGAWDVWLQGELMPSVSVSVDGRRLASIGGQLEGNPHNPDTMPPLRVRLSAGTHRLTVTRGGANLAPGDGGEAILREIVVTAAGDDVDTLHVTPPVRWRSLCGGRFDWIEAVGG
jgi:hypothetical protein